MGGNRREFLLGAASVAAGFSIPSLSSGEAHGRDAGAGGARDGGSPFLLERDGIAVTSLRYAGDTRATNYVAMGQRLGHVEITWRRPGGPWQKFHTAEAQGSSASPGSFRAKDERGEALAVMVGLKPRGRLLRWTVGLENLCAEPIEVGDLALPLPMHAAFSPKGSHELPVLKHSFVSGNGSFLFWMRSNSAGPYLMMTPERNTALEYWDHLWPRVWPRDVDHPKFPAYRVFVHSVAVGEEVKAHGGRWRQPRTSVTLAPAGKGGARQRYGFQLAWVPGYAGVRQRLVDAGLMDVEVAPGMTVPADLSTCIAIRSREPVEGIVAEHPKETTIEALGEREGRKLYRVKFGRLGENLLTVNQGKGRVTRLEFFAAEPLETLIHKRAAFTTNLQIRDDSKWYNGLLPEWNMQSEVRLSPDNYDRIKGWRIYEVTCDDAGLSKPAYIASKNAEYPDQGEVEALDYYIEHFVWGGLQRTTEESYSYGIYGIPDWKTNRDSSDPGPKGKLHIWRCYDYPHIVVMYFSLYKVARDYPGIRTKLDRETYLERAYGTAVGMFTIPMEVVGWSAYRTGFYNEVVIPHLIEELDAAGKHAEASRLRGYWEKKVVTFVGGNLNLFSSEYAFDSTGFESTEAIARYAFDHPETPGITRQETEKFSERQMRDNLFCRGVVEKAYYYYGSDYRAGAGDSYTLSYMAPMGGWGVLDYALHDGPNPDATIRLGYASFLSSWSLMNTGTPESGYGYWFPGKGSDGGTGGGFEPPAYDITWLGQPNDRGDWYYSCETDLGYCGALRTAATIVADDPVFGRFCFGGEMVEEKAALRIIPRDGVRRRLRLRTGGRRMDFELRGARFAKDEAIEWFPDQGRFVFRVETESTGSGDVELMAGGLAHPHKVICGAETKELGAGENATVRLRVAAGSAKTRVEVVRS